jgi:ATP-dependent Clp protease ATP-binding subunit ClpC
VFERFSDRARRVLVLAQEEARLLNHGFIGTEHILLGLIHEGEGIAARALEQLDVSLEAVRQRVEETIGVAGTPLTGSPPFTPRAKKVLELSLREALQLGHNYIGTEHLLLGLVREGEGVAAQVLISSGVDLARVRQQVILLLSEYASENPQSAQSAPPPGSVARRGPRQAQPVECSFCGRRPPESGQLLSGRRGAFVCEHCVRELGDRFDGDPEAT